jgi:hypothetical protein
MINPNNPFFQRTVDQVNSYEENLWENLDRVPHLAPEIGEAILRIFLEQACLCQNSGNILTGRYGIKALPKEWVLAHIEALAEPLLEEATDEWEYCRLLEVYWGLDKVLVQKLALSGLHSQNNDIQEAAQACLEKLADPTVNQEMNYWEIRSQKS